MLDRPNGDVPFAVLEVVSPRRRRRLSRGERLERSAVLLLAFIAVIVFAVWLHLTLGAAPQ